MYLPWNAPIEAPGRTLVFGEVEGGVEVIVPKVEGEKAGDSNSDQDIDNGDVDGTTSGDTVNSTRVEGTRLAEKSQHMCQS